MVRFAIVAACIGLGLFGLWRYALATQGVAILDRFDRLVGGTVGTRLALSGGSYGPLPAQRVDIVVPASPAGPRPVIVFVHGGGWDSGSPAEYHFLGRAFARAGYVVVLPGYRLTPDGAWPHMLQDTASAVGWVHDHVASYGGDPDRVFLMGQSAGAYNVVMVALERQWLGRAGVADGFVKGVVGLSGPYDFLPLTTPSAQAAFGQVRPAAITQPVSFARGDAPPMLLLTGDRDETVKPRNTASLAAALSAAGGQVETVTVPGADHRDTIIKLAQPFLRDRRVVDPVLAFLARHGGASAPVQAKGG
ncbi:MAG: alpha/beta hydrolase fold domain-containing protein [Proteobacteria bacterium]|nr:alpha/beta hydrolase fold domain-containing protein [Pseudomonadota bacterium]